MSNTSHNLTAKATNATLEQAVRFIVHPSLRGFIPGRGMSDNVFEALAPMHVAPQLQHSVPAIVLFGIKAAFPSVSWRWIWRVLRATGAFEWLINTIRLLDEASFFGHCICGRGDVLWVPRQARHPAGLPGLRVAMGHSFRRYR